MLSLVETILNSLAKLAQREPILGHVTACPSGLEQDLFSANTRPRRRGSIRRAAKNWGWPTNGRSVDQITKTPADQAPTAEWKGLDRRTHPDR